MSMHQPILLALLCLWTTTDSLLVVQSPSHLAKEHMAVGYTFIGKQGEWLISGKLVQADPIYPCDVSKIKNAAAIQGAIVVTKHGNCIEGDQARVLKALGAQGMMVWSSSGFFFQGGLKNNDGEGLDDFPMVDFVNLGNEDTEALKLALDNNEDIVVTLAPDPNFVADEAVWTPYSIFIIGFSLVNIVLAVWKLQQFVKVFGFQLSLGQIVLSLEIFANLMRIPHGIEPASEGRGVFPATLQSLLFTFSWPYSFIATMMIAFYWEETLARFSGKAGLSKENFSSLKKMKIPAIIVSVVLIGMEHILQGLIAARLPGLGTSSYITSAIYLAVALVVGIYFAVTGCRVVLFLRKTVVFNSGTRILRRMGLLVSMSGIGLLVYILGNIITAASISSNNISFIAFSEALLFAGLDISSTTQILCFTSPGDEATNSNSLSGSKSYSKSKSGKDPKENSVSKENFVPTSVQPAPAVVSDV